MRTVLVTPPAIEPVSLELARLQCRITAEGSPPAHYEDALLALYEKAAREQVETYTNRKLITQTWRGRLDLFPENIVFPFGPISSVVSVGYLDDGAMTQTLAADQYALDNADPDRPAWLLPSADGEPWPTTYAAANAVTVQFVAGYGATAADVPPQTIAAILVLLANMYGNREANADEDTWRTVRRLVDPLRLFIEQQ